MQINLFGYRLDVWMQFFRREYRNGRRMDGQSFRPLPNTSGRRLDFRFASLVKDAKMRFATVLFEVGLQLRFGIVLLLGQTPDVHFSLLAVDCEMSVFRPRRTRQLDKGKIWQENK